MVAPSFEITLAASKKYDTVHGTLSFQDAANVFSNDGATKMARINAGEQALVCIINGKDGDILNDMRYQKFCSKVQWPTTQYHNS